MASGAFGVNVAVLVLPSYATVAGTTASEASVRTKLIVPGWTASLNVAVTAVVVETLVAPGAGVCARHRAAACWRTGGEDDIDPVVGRALRRWSGSRRGAVEVDAVAAAVDLVRQRVQRPAVDTLAGEVAAVGGVMARRCVVRGDVVGVGGDRHRGGEVDLLPARGGLAGEGGGGQQRAGAGPEVADVGAGVVGALVEPDAGDVAGDVGAEPHADLGRRSDRSRGRPRRASAEGSRW